MWTLHVFLDTVPRGPRGPSDGECLRTYVPAFTTCSFSHSLSGQKRVVAEWAEEWGGNDIEKSGYARCPVNIRHIARKEGYCSVPFNQKERMQLISARNDDGLRKTSRPKRAAERSTSPDYRPNATELRRARFCGGRATSRVTDH